MALATIQPKPPVWDNQAIAGYMKDIKEGDLVAFDPIFGRERVMFRNDYTLANKVEVAHLQLRTFGPPYGPPAFSGTRFIVRALGEPCFIWHLQPDEQA